MEPQHLTHLGHTVHKLLEAIDTEMKSNLGDEVTTIIQTHAAICAGGGLIPVPVIDVVVIITNTWTMYVRINKAIDIPFGKNIMKSIATGIATNLISIIPGIALAKVAGALAKMIPGIGSIGGMAIDASVNYALTLVMGIIYLKALTMLYESNEPITEESIRQAAKEAAKDKDFIRESFNEAKQQYKPK